VPAARAADQDGDLVVFDWHDESGQLVGAQPAGGFALPTGLRRGRIASWARSVLRSVPSTSRSVPSSVMVTSTDGVGSGGRTPAGSKVPSDPVAAHADVERWVMTFGPVHRCRWPSMPRCRVERPSLRKRQEGGPMSSPAAWAHEAPKSRSSSQRRRPTRHGCSRLLGQRRCPH
jgi:hypothetical protein